MAGKERPILFSAPMVRAILDGRKSQTRRAVKPAPVSAPKEPLVSFNHGVPEWSFGLEDRDARGLRWWRCPYGVPGDRLWVRETFLQSLSGTTLPSGEWHSYYTSEKVEYAADGAEERRLRPDQMYSPWMKKRPSIHMPRWASRITLRITDVRVERLNEISEADALAEGMTFPEGMQWGQDPLDAYRGQWEHINGPGSWDASPWVWVVAFEREAA